VKTARDFHASSRPKNSQPRCKPVFYGFSASAARLRFSHFPTFRVARKAAQFRSCVVRDLAVQIMLRVPDVAEAVGPLVGRSVTDTELFTLIAAGVIEPFGYKAPVFLPNQIADIAASLRERDAHTISSPTQEVAT
jgi:hypothetical protein